MKGVTSYPSYGTITSAFACYKPTLETQTMDKYYSYQQMSQVIILPLRRAQRISEMLAVQLMVPHPQTGSI
jgi:hypothetical protein